MWKTLKSVVQLSSGKKGRWWLSDKGPTCQCRFDPWARKNLWRREWLPILVFLPGESHGQGSLAGCSPWGRKALDTPEQLIHMLPLRRLSECRSSFILGPFFQYGRDFPVAQTVKNLPVSQETRVRSLGWEVPL